MEGGRFQYYADKTYLQLIRNKGRHAFLAPSFDNFSKIVDDYTDERKGFMVWKNMLEERVL